MNEQQVRAQLESMPSRIAKLPLDERGYPVPWFVAWIDGKPEFRAANGVKFVQAIRQRLCWVCGEPLGRNLAFLAGPMCGINRTSAEPPNHLECAQWSARNCPYLNNPHAVRRQDEFINNEISRQSAPGMMICRNPGVAMVWVTREYEVFPDDKGGALITMGEPERVEWYAEGRLAARAEVVASIESGLPNLEAIAKQQAGALQALREARERFEKYLPVEATA